MVGVGDRQRAMARTLVCERAAARGLRRTGVRGVVGLVRAIAGEVLAIVRARSRTKRVRRDVVGESLPGNHRRRPAQVFCGLRDRWDVGMSKPSAFTVPPPLHRWVQQEGVEPSYPGLVRAHLPPGPRLDSGRSPGRARVTTLPGRPSARSAAGLAWAHEHAPTRRTQLRQLALRVKQKIVCARNQRAQRVPLIGASQVGAEGALPWNFARHSWSVRRSKLPVTSS